MGRSHLISGAAAGAWLAVALDPTPAVGLAGVVLGMGAAMAPDLDHPSARAVTRLSIVGLALCHMIRFISRITTGVEHRGLSHSLAFAALLGWLTYLPASVALEQSQALYLGVSVSVGVIAALLGDLVTLAGLQFLLWPFGVEVSIPYWMRIKTNGVAERFVVLPLLIVATVAGIAEMAGVVSLLLEGANHGT